MLWSDPFMWSDPFTRSPAQARGTNMSQIGRNRGMNIAYPVASTVSIWIGNFSSECDFDRCVDGPITRLLGIQTPLASFCEVAFEDDPQVLRKLIEGFSGWETFIDQAERSAHSRGFQAANAVLVCYNVKCEDAPDTWGEMRFLGTFTGQDIA